MNRVKGLEKIAWTILLLTFSVFGWSASAFAAGSPDEYALDDAHNHDGTHVDGQENCGGNYMNPGQIARLGSHSFLILGQDGPEHLLLDHRSGTPPHNYQYILRVKVDAREMAVYHKISSQSKRFPPAVTTIDFDQTGKQVGRTFFCNHDLEKIFGSEKKAGDSFEKLFPIRASWQKEADFEGAFPIRETVVPEEPMVIDRRDVELVVSRYLPSYLEQSSFRQTLKKNGSSLTSILSHSPKSHDDDPKTAANRSSYAARAAFESNGDTCSSDPFLKKVRPPKTRHAFLILAETSPQSVLAVHLYDQSPQNFQTLMHFQLSNAEMKIVREARQSSKSPLLFRPDAFFCMNDLKNLVREGQLVLKGALFKDAHLTEFETGSPVGELNIESKSIRVLLNRKLQSLMNPQAVARDVFGFVDVQTLDPQIQVEIRYATDWNFLGRPVAGYKANRCYLTETAARALIEVQKEANKSGLSLLLFDCYRPQKAVNDFIAWTKGAEDSKTKGFFYPDERRESLIQKGYLASRSGHSRGSTVDLTLVKRKAGPSKSSFREKFSDCRQPFRIEETGQLDMGTSYDCLSKKSGWTASDLTAEAMRNRETLKRMMEKHGFQNYSKEWWHFTLKNEPYKEDLFDFEVQ